MLLGFFLAALLAPAGASAQSTATLKGVDIYRSESLSLEQVQKAVSPLLKRYVHLRNDGRKSSLAAAERLKAPIEEEVRKLARLAFVGLHCGEYVTSAERFFYVTFDVVDSKDSKARMPFRAAPSAGTKDPEGLLGAWRQYQERGSGLMREGLITTSEHPTCPGFYCLWGSQNEELSAFEKRFSQGASRNKGPLLGVLERERDPKKRAAAVYLLAYLPDGREVSGIMLRALEDPSEEVRGAGLQVLADMALLHPPVFIEARRIIPLLDGPTVSDRAKALGALVGLAGQEAYRPYLLAHATPFLLGLLRLQQPSNHDLAYTLLTLLSKESYDRRDYASWEAWISAQKAGTSGP